MTKPNAFDALSKVLRARDRELHWDHITLRDDSIYIEMSRGVYLLVCVLFAALLSLSVWLIYEVVQVAADSRVSMVIFLVIGTAMSILLLVALTIRLVCGRWWLDISRTDEHVSARLKMYRSVQVLDAETKPAMSVWVKERQQNDSNRFTYTVRLGTSVFRSIEFGATRNKTLAEKIAQLVAILVEGKLDEKFKRRLNVQRSLARMKRRRHAAGKTTPPRTQD